VYAQNSPEPSTSHEIKIQQHSWPQISCLLFFPHSTLAIWVFIFLEHAHHVCPEPLLLLSLQPCLYSVHVYVVSIHSPCLTFFNSVPVGMTEITCNNKHFTLPIQDVSLSGQLGFLFCVTMLPWQTNWRGLTSADELSLWVSESIPLILHSQCPSPLPSPNLTCAGKSLLITTCQEWGRVEISGSRLITTSMSLLELLSTDKPRWHSIPLLTMPRWQTNHS
jgi:hypothetical protein